MGWLGHWLLVECTHKRFQIRVIFLLKLLFSELEEQSSDGGPPATK
ncbi:hypothetical protein [Ktedonobacter sp. SOSP1-85]